MKSKYFVSGIVNSQIQLFRMIYPFGRIRCFDKVNVWVMMMIVQGLGSLEEGASVPWLWIASSSWV